MSLLVPTATVQAPPPVVFHTAPVTARSSILADGLLPARPADRDTATWLDGLLLSGQQRGVYVTDQPDLTGQWARGDRWDVWQVPTADVVWLADQLHHGSWCLLDPVPAAPFRLSHHGG